MTAISSNKYLVAIASFCLLSGSLACGSGSQQAEAAALPEVESATQVTEEITVLPSETPVPTYTPRPIPTADLSIDPFDDISIDALSERGYGGTGIVLDEVLTYETHFTQYSMHYDSDGLSITGLIDIPVGEPPFPVVIINHGYIVYESYDPGDDTGLIAERFAEADYIAVMPDYRNYGASDKGPNPFRTGYAIDVMNLTAQLESLEQANPEQIGMLGHSMGGEVSMWPMVISDEVDAVVLYGAMSGDTAQNWSWRLQQWPA